MKYFNHRNMTVEERIFNYRLSRGHQIGENAFGDPETHHAGLCLSTQPHENEIPRPSECSNGY